MKHRMTQTLLGRLCNEHSNLDRNTLQTIAVDFGISYGEVAGVASFYSAVNKLPAEERVDPALGTEGPIINHAKTCRWQALAKARSCPNKIIDEVELSGLSGRGGGAYPTGKKWRAVEEAATEKYVICNVSEGEPGTAKDLFLLNNYPEAVVEGIAICALAVGAHKAFVYIRAGYSDAADTMRAAIRNARGKLYDLDIEVAENLGAYICGEETALIASLEGERGEPRRKPPFPTECGLLGAATVINNAETFATIPLIIEIGGNAFKEKETRLFTVTGCGAAAVICEMNVACSPQDLFCAAGCDGPAKAFQLGGGASGCIFPASYMGISFSSSEAVDKHISLGAGSLRFIAEDESLPEICKGILRFYADESCGKCTPCRLGTKKLAEMLSVDADSYQLRKTAEYISASSSCALGKSATNALLSAMEYFPDEFANNDGREIWL